MDVQILGKVHAPHRIGDDAQRSGRDHHGHDGQPVQTIGQVHRIGRPHDHDHREGHEQKAKVQQGFLEHREGQLVGQRIGVVLRGPIPSNGRDQ